MDRLETGRKVLDGDQKIVEKKVKGGIEKI